MNSDEQEKLTQDIRVHGLLEPIITFEGQILDGRHRFQACETAGVAPRFEEFVGGDPVSYVLSKNLHRRHLTSAQKAAIAVEALPLLEKQAKKRQRQAGEQFGRGQERVAKVPQKIGEPIDNKHDTEAVSQAAHLTGTNRQYVADAKRVATEAPDVFHAMKAGTVSLPEAQVLTHQSESDRQKILAALPELSPMERRAQFRVVPPEPKSPPETDEIEPETEMDGEDEAHVAEAPSGPLDVHFSSESPEWYTPSDVLERVITALEGIDLDPCSNTPLDDLGQGGNVPATRHFTARDNGLRQPWTGRVFMNPPYGREISRWTGKLLFEFEAGHVSQAIALVPARVDTAWFRSLSAFPVAFWRGRITFIGPNGEQNPAPFPSALFALGIAAESFARVFADVADVYLRLKPEKKE